MLKSLILIMMSAVLINNLVLTQFLGIESVITHSKNKKSALWMSVCVLIVMILATLITWPLNTYILVPNSMDYLQSFLFIFIILMLVKVLDIIGEKTTPYIHNIIDELFPLIAANSAVLGLTLINANNSENFLEALFNSVGAGIGFILAMWLFAAVRRKLETANPPKPFRGIPIYLISAAIVSLAFYGFAGMF